MKKVLACLVAGAVAAPAMAANLNMTIKSGGSSSINVAPGATVNFTIEAVLDDGNNNEGAALIGFDLHYTGGNLPANAVNPPAGGAASCVNAMAAFIKPDGITNPVGFIGTSMGGDLVQVGGAQNTIKNSVDNPACAPNCAPFPVGAPFLGVAQPGVCGLTVIATGSITAPLVGGETKLQIKNAFANVIKNGETLADPFLETEAAGVTTLPPPDATIHAQLIINVTDGCGIASSVPAHCLTDARQPHVQFNVGALQGYNSIAVTFSEGCDVSGAVVGDFSIACTPAGAPCPTINNVNTVDQTVTVALSSVIPAKKWTCITHTASGDQVCVGSMPGDVNGNHTTLPSDIIDIIDNLNGILIPALPMEHCDLDRSNACLPADIITLIDMLNGVGFAAWNGQSLPALGACPAP